MGTAHPISLTDGNVYTQDAIVETGFNGWLSLLPDSISQTKNNLYKATNESKH